MLLQDLEFELGKRGLYNKDHLKENINNLTVSTVIEKTIPEEKPPIEEPIIIKPTLEKLSVKTPPQKKPVKRKKKKVPPPQKLVLKKNVSHKNYDWNLMARPKQKLPPGEWTVWLILAGRGFGKTRTGAETIRSWVESGLCKRLAIVAETEDEARMVMIEGPSGLLSICPPHSMPVYKQCKGELTWPNGAQAHVYSSENYNKLRGPQFDGAWIDELAKYRYPSQLWDQLMFGLRLGEKPRVIITTTPRPIPLLEYLMEDSATYVTRGSTHENEENLSPHFIKQILKNYEGTRLGAQEIYAEFLTERPGALWNKEMILYGVPPNESERVGNTKEETIIKNSWSLISIGE